MVAVAMTAGLSAAPSIAAPSDHPSYPAPGGKVSALPASWWTLDASGATATAPMPGNIPGEVVMSRPDATYNKFVPYTDGNVLAPTTLPDTGAGWTASVMSARADSGAQAGDAAVNPDFKSCLVGETEQGASDECTSYRVTITFPHPQVNPVITFASGSAFPGEMPSGEPVDYWGCWATRAEIAFAAVNGARPAAGQVTLAGSTDSGLSTTFTDDRLRLTGAYSTNPGPASLCAPDLGRMRYSFEVAGLVTSVDLDIPVVADITKTASAETLHEVTHEPQWTLGFLLNASDLAITKQAWGTPGPGDELVWSLEVENLGEGDSRGFVVRDALPAAVDDARIVNVPIVDGRSICALDGRDLRCELAPEGASLADVAGSSTFVGVEKDDTTSFVRPVLEAGERMSVVLAATIPTDFAGEIENVAALAGADLDPDTSNNTSRVTSEVPASTWSLAKTASVGGRAPAGGIVEPGDRIDYTVTATSTRGLVDDIVLSDDLSDVLDGAEFVKGSARLTTPGAGESTLPDPSGNRLVTPEFALREGESATLTYSVIVSDDSWMTSLRNVVTGDAAFPVTECDPCATTSRTHALLQIQKNGVDSAGETIAVAGSSFEVRADDAGAPGDVIDDMPVTEADGTGRFEVRNLPPGTYWLVETATPVGHELLPEPIKFDVGSDGVPRVSADANAGAQIVDGVLNVYNRRALVLPNAGAGGETWMLAGSAVLLCALGTATITPFARRRRPGRA
jgi:hypothetical protein